MSGEKATSPCNKFQANIFNKSKCQNCFKSRELHLLTDNGMEQAKPLYGGWLCLAPEGTDFDNPMQKSRKWQRRFFILYEDGSLSFALDELTSTLPQGTVNLNLCTDVADAEPKTGQRNALCIVTPEQEIFIRGDNKEIINGWTEQLAVYLRTNKQNQKKKRKVELVATQEPSPAKMAATDPSFPSSGNAPESGCGRGQEDPQQGSGPGETPMWTVLDSDPRGLDKKTPAGNTSSYLSPVSLDLVTSGNTECASRNQSNNNPTANNQNQSQDTSRGSPTERLLGWEATENEEEGTAVSRTGRSEARTNKREKLQSPGDFARLAAPPPQRRAKSLDRRTSDTVMTPDLLNFKKGWMVKLEENEQWKKYWFVLSMDSLRCYKDSVAEEASDLNGEIDLTRCYSVSEYLVQRNYGFQIHTPKGVFTLSAMTSGIRRNWIQALMKNVRPAKAPDVASLPGPAEALPKPDVTQDSADDPHPKRRSVMERRREGRYKTFDWAEFRPQNKRSLDPQRTKALCSLEFGELERRKRREDRRRRYESMLGSPLGWEAIGGTTSGVRALSPKSQQKVDEEIEECWKQVEKTVFRLERNVPLIADAKDSVEAERLLDGYRNGVEDLKAQLAESERHRLDLEAQLSSAGLYTQQPDPPRPSEADFRPSDANDKPANGSAQTPEDAGEETRELLLEQQNRINAQEPLGLASPPLTPQTPGIWLHDAEGGFQALGDLLPGTEDAPLLLSPSASEILFPQSDGQTVDLKQVPGSGTQMSNGDFGSLIPETPSEGDDDDSLGGCVELHLRPDRAMVGRLSQEVELLTGQNEALNRRNQEMLNQLTEADREIERLKAELGSRYTEPRHLPEVEQLAQTRVEELEGELSSRDQQLMEAQTMIVSLEENLREMEALLQLNAPREAEEAENKGYLLRCFEATEAKLTELERKLHQSELACAELGAQNAALREAEERGSQTAAEAEADIRRLREELEEARRKDGESNRCVSGEERIRQVIEGMVMRLKALERLLEVINKFDLGLRKEEEEEKTPAVEGQLRWEEEFWGFLLDKLKVDPSELHEEKPEEELLSEVTERMMAEKQMLLLGHRLLSETCADEGLKEPDVIWRIASETETDEMEESRIFDFDHRPYEMEYFRSAAQVKISLLNRLASSVGASAHDDLRLTADRLSVRHPWSGFIHSAATEALHCRRLSRLQAKYERRLEETQRKPLAPPSVCSDCVALTEENRELRATLSTLEARRSSSGDKTSRWSQTEEAHRDTSVQVADRSGAEEEGESLEAPLGGELVIQETADGNTEKSDESQEETDASGAEAEQLKEQLMEQLKEQLVEQLEEQLKEQLKEQEEQLEEQLKEQLEEQLKEQLKEQLAVRAEEMKEELDGRMSSVQTQHETEMEKLKVTCERGFASMEESHLKVVEELQRRHQQEVERLLVGRDALLEEESAATATALQAITNAHRLELEKEVQKRCRCQDGTGDAHLENVHRQHREESASYQRELEVLSQQFSLKCLENGHLVQALDAERKALCQCQQENQDLRTRNQELSGHLAAEITRLCSLAKEDALPLSQGMGAYEMEITLRVKESELQCLKQEITSLRDDLQSAQRDKRIATKKCKSMYTELSITRAKMDRDTDELRGNLRLAHRALDQTSP
ncbi:myosin phosphatase Rho-interacting protein-like [Cyclopterus lumpus]|uniref:myosin phosphatase Rho-interacting protein-like n=1 Tax=Cyclopterus lumpus TaxID=8103 RepID=UPI00148635D3|nr:myosin phosphatase Rho-interacting protein-like [Cyclopterus lumpus]